jgi:hypothetical protein
LKAGFNEETAKKYEETFKENEIELDQLEDLSYDLLASVNIKAGPAMKIMKLKGK